MQAESEEAEQQRKQAVNDRRLQAAIAREEKARETALKKIAAAEARAAVKEEKLRQKAEKQAERELQRKRKAEEAAQRKLIAEEKRKQRLEAKKSRMQSVNQKKRGREEEDTIRPQKRLRTELKQPRNRREAPESIEERDSTTFKLQNNNRTNTTGSMLNARMRAEDRRPISLPLRSGRAVHLPARFR
jgi:colicin import membrane protein